jgi:hypothetical protein
LRPKLSAQPSRFEALAPFGEDRHPQEASSQSSYWWSAIRPSRVRGSCTSIDGGITFTYAGTDPDHTDFVCRRFDLIGPGDGDWVLSLENSTGVSGTISASDVPDGPRRILYDDILCAFDKTYTVTLLSGSGAGIDAVLN